jgi:hypothetical protein
MGRASCVSPTSLQLIKSLLNQQDETHNPGHNSGREEY